MEKKSLDCYVLPGQPMPVILPTECVAAVVEKPQLEVLSEAPANWMKGHVTWQNQRLPVMSFTALQDPKLDESKQRQACLVVLNPIPDAARKVFAGLLCFGEVKKLTVDADLEYDQLPKNADRRYIDAVVRIGGQRFIIPKLTALGVAFSYF